MAHLLASTFHELNSPLLWFAVVAVAAAVVVVAAACVVNAVV